MRLRNRKTANGEAATTEVDPFEVHTRFTGNGGKFDRRGAKGFANKGTAVAELQGMVTVNVDMEEHECKAFTETLNVKFD